MATIVQHQLAYTLSQSAQVVSCSNTSGEDDVICACGQRFGRKSSLVRHFDTRCAKNPKLNQEAGEPASRTRNERNKRPSAPSPILTPRSSGAKRPLVGCDGDVQEGPNIVTFEEDGKTEKLLRCKFKTIKSYHCN